MILIDSIELISFKVCPFVQRTVVVAKEKNIDLKIKYIDIENKPDWFLKVSPLGKVPLLRVGDQSIFESSVIMNFFDEITEGNLCLTDPVQNAINNSWIEFSHELISNQFQYFRCKDHYHLEKKRATYINSLTRLEQIVDSAPYFNGTVFNLIDAAFSSVFKCQEIVSNFTGEYLLESFPKLTLWGSHLMKRTSVQQSTTDDYEQELIVFLQSMESILLKKYETIGK